MRERLSGREREREGEMEGRKQIYDEKHFLSLDQMEQGRKYWIKSKRRKEGSRREKTGVTNRFVPKD